MCRRTLAVVFASIVVGFAAPGCHDSQPEQPTPGRPAAPPRAPLPAPPAPELNGYQEVAANDYQVADQYVAFQTPDGLTCRIGSSIGCDGAIHGTLAPANEVVLNGTPAVAGGRVEPSGFRQTAQPRFAAPPGAPPKLLPPRHKIVYQGTQCAVDSGAITVCAHGSPPVSWFVLSPTRSGIGPRIANLPPKFPDPHDFVVDEQSYTVGSGGRNIFPYFTVASGLTCNISVFSGGAVGCDGPLPGMAEADSEIYIDLSGRRVGMRTTDTPRFTTHGTIKQLPAWHRIDYTYETFTTCLAGGDGGVACYAQSPDHPRGFVVSAHSAWTFGD
ncbi:hypothetical protein GCM10009641_10690 [Mycobacterium cookii]|uniref:Lipoprotein n=1 Tax=Mycobacterium cookii TaxID=1775 RepID=A0A7I7L1N0_9MYCO|nr:hypothetical protein MCOO_39010 [Mycobacterium cookii]